MAAKEYPRTRKLSNSTEDVYEIYELRCRATRKVYVGYTKMGIWYRWRDHVFDVARGRKNKLSLAIIEHGWEEWDFLCLATASTLEDAHRMERLWIAKFQANIDEFGYNETEGGQGFISDEDVRRKIGEAARLRWQDPELRKRMTNSKIGNKYGLGKKWTPEKTEKMSRIMIGNTLWLGRKHTEEWKRKQSQRSRGNLYCKGRRHTEETRRKMSENMKGNKNGVRAVRS